MSQSLRSLLRIETADDLQGSATAVQGKHIIFQTTCHNCSFSSYHDNCCNTFIVPADVSSATFDIWGGGGGGGRLQCCGTGPGGQSGSYAQKSVPVNPGDCYAVRVGFATHCSSSERGCTGCHSCVCGVNLNGTTNEVQVCAQGGGGGCWCCSGNCCVDCARRITDTRTATGGDINMNAVPSCDWIRCRSNSCYDKVGVAYPGGIVNKCGGNIWMNRCSTHCEYTDYMACMAGNTLDGFFRGDCRGYVPGMAGQSGSGICGDYCCYYWWYGCCVPCGGSSISCGASGNSGLVRVTYK